MGIMMAAIRNATKIRLSRVPFSGPQGEPVSGEDDADHQDGQEVDPQGGPGSEPRRDPLQEQPVEGHRGDDEADDHAEPHHHPHRDRQKEEGRHPSRHPALFAGGEQDLGRGRDEGEGHDDGGDEGEGLGVGQGLEQLPLRRLEGEHGEKAHHRGEDGGEHGAPDLGGRPGTPPGTPSLRDRRARGA